MVEQQPAFTIDGFYKFVHQGKLMAGRCLKCGKIHLPPRPMCDNCFSQEFEWVKVPEKGELLAYTVIHVTPKQFQSMAPYTVGIVKLENGMKIPGMISNVSPGEIKIGMKLTLDFNECALSTEWPRWPRYCFKPT
jgi:hypothetical protein